MLTFELRASTSLCCIEREREMAAVLLKSADEQEFRVDRDVALQSALIKNILEGALHGFGRVFGARVLGGPHAWGPACFGARVEVVLTDQRTLLCCGVLECAVA